MELAASPTRLPRILLPPAPPSAVIQSTFRAADRCTNCNPANVKLSQSADRSSEMKCVS